MPEQPHTLTFAQANAFLDEAAQRLPPELFRELNGGIVLLPQAKLSPESQHKDLYTLGLYHHEPHGLGRYITLYYGSFVRVFGHESLEKQQEELDRVLRHELTHHIESLAGVNNLMVKDAQQLAQYKAKKTKKEPLG